MSAKRKPMTVDAIMDEPEVADAPATIPAINEQRGAAGQRSHVKQMTAYLPHPVYRQLRELAFHEERRMHSLLMEGLDRVFAR